MYIFSNLTSITTDGLKALDSLIYLSRLSREEVKKRLAAYPEDIHWQLNHYRVHGKFPVDMYQVRREVNQEAE